MATARSLSEHCIRRIYSIDAAGPRLRAVLEINPDALACADRLDRERALGRARGQLHGVPVLVKDNIDAGDLMRSTAGSLALMESQPAGDAHVVELLRAQGAVILGKTNLTEWSNFRGEGSHSGWSGVGGQTRNPHVLDRSPLGSSSGSAAAVAAGLCPVALGTETDGSIVGPATANGVVGIKPSVGLTSRTGVCPIAASQDTVGAFGRTVADAATLLEAIVGQDERDQATLAWPEDMCVSYSEHLIGVDGLHGKRIGVLREWDEQDARAGAVCNEAVKALEAHGATVVGVTLPPAVASRRAMSGPRAVEERIASREQVGPGDQPQWFDGMDDELFILTYELRRDLTAYLATRVPFKEDALEVDQGGLRGTAHAAGRVVRTLDDIIQFNRIHAHEELMLFGQEHMENAAKSVGADVDAHYLATLASNHRCSREEGLDAVMSTHRLDALLAPAGSPAGETQPRPGGEFRFYMASSTWAAVAGYPLVSVPAGTWAVDGKRLPLNMNFMGRRWDEARLLQIAHGFEQATLARVEPRYVPTLDAEAALRKACRL